MITRHELVGELPRLIAAAAAPLEVAEFEPQDFDPERSEQFVRAIRGWKQDFSSGLHFWVKSLQARGWEGRESYLLPYAQAGLCEPMSGPEFSRLVAEHSGSLRKQLPPFILDLGGFQSGLRMYADWNDVAAVADLDEAYVAFHWSTSA